MRTERRTVVVALADGDVPVHPSGDGHEMREDGEGDRADPRALDEGDLRAEEVVDGALDEVSREMGAARDEDLWDGRCREPVSTTRGVGWLHQPLGQQTHAHR